MAGTFTGREEIFAFLGRLPKETDGTYASSLIDVLASDDRAAALYRASGERNGRGSSSTRSAVPDRGRARAGGAGAAERPCRIRYVLGVMSDRLRSLRRAHLRLLRDPDRLGAGLLDALQPVLAPRGVDASEDELLELYARHEAELEAGPYLPYREIVARVAAPARRRARARPLRRGGGRFRGARSATGPRSPTRRPRSGTCSDRFRLGVITNCDRDLFARSNRRLGVTFDWIVTAEDARAYKPSLAPFELAFATIDVPRERILHVAQSLFHDHVPAQGARPHDACGSTAATTGRGSARRRRRWPSRI